MNLCPSTSLCHNIDNGLDPTYLCSCKTGYKHVNGTGSEIVCKGNFLILFL